MNDYKEKTDDMFYLHLARNQLALIREENKKWQHSWDIQSIIDVIDIVAPEIVIGTFPEKTTICYRFTSFKKISSRPICKRSIHRYRRCEEISC